MAKQVHLRRCSEMPDYWIRFCVCLNGEVYSSAIARRGTGVTIFPSGYLREKLPGPLSNAWLVRIRPYHLTCLNLVCVVCRAACIHRRRIVVRASWTSTASIQNPMGEMQDPRGLCLSASQGKS
jgi:hypothetical protein